MHLDFKNIHESKTVRGIIIGISIAVIALLILFVGINVGRHQAEFACQFGGNFEKNFMGPKMGGGIFGGMPSGHGAAGEIISINLPQIVVSGPDNLEKIITISDGSVIRRFREGVASADLKVGDFIVVIGDPNNQGEIEAKLIRVMPSPNN